MKFLQVARQPSEEKNNFGYFCFDSHSHIFYIAPKHPKLKFTHVVYKNVENAHLNFLQPQVISSDCFI